eukprot:COSAG01_NODE_2437_length_7694_cov_47.587887_5_plen_1699_part_01
MGRGGSRHVRTATLPRSVTILLASALSIWLLAQSSHQLLRGRPLANLLRGSWTSLLYLFRPRRRPDSCPQLSDGSVRHAAARASALLPMLRGGDDEAAAMLTGVLERALEALSRVGVSVTAEPKPSRAVRKVIVALIEQIEGMMEEVAYGDGRAVSQLSCCEEAALAGLCERLCAVEELLPAPPNARTRDELPGSPSLVPCVQALLDWLERCVDPPASALRVIASGRMLGDGGSGDDVMWALHVLRGLPLSVLERRCDGELAAVKVVLSLLGRGARGVAERTSAAYVLFTLCLRNASTPFDEHSMEEFCRQFSEIHREWAQACSEQLAGALELDAATFSIGLLLADLGPKADPSTHALVEHFFTMWTSTFRSDFFYKLLTVDRLRQLLPTALGFLTDGSNRVRMAGTANLLATCVAYSQAALSDVLLSPAVTNAILASVLSVWDPAHSVSWWNERFARIHLDTIYLGASLHLMCQMVVRGIPEAIPVSIQRDWDELLRVKIQLLKLAPAAKLSKKTPMPSLLFFFCLTSVSKQASFAPKRQQLLQAGIPETLLYISANNSPKALGISIAGAAAQAAVSLIGRNEGGLTLSREAANAVLDTFGNFFDQSHRHRTALVQRVITVSDAITHMCVSDANKLFIVKHPSAVENLVAGLLLEETNPRRHQLHAERLQQGCVLALQNLALSPVSAAPIRAHPRVMQALRAVAECGMTDESRRCAIGALFELDVERVNAPNRHHDDLMSTDIAHIMLSYNWDHQDVIKRINASLVSRGYTTWIDVERMQGSTVEAMADAVEGAAVMCYGVSRAYKESASCRMEAQYAYQQKKDMVPLMVEEGYHADGWLGMLLGTRLWYGFCGLTLESAGAFESRMEELCRELADRGLMKAQAAAPGAGRDASLSAYPALDYSGDDKIRAVEAVLECIGRVIPLVKRKQRKELSCRVDALLEDVDDAEIPAWLSVTWTDEQLAAVTHASEMAQAAETAASVTESEAADAVKTVLEALEDVVASTIHKAEQMMAAIKSGEMDAMVSVLDRSLVVLETLAQSLCRKERRPIDVLCEKVEGALEAMQAQGVVAQLMSCEEPELTTLCASMKAVAGLHADCETEECVPTITAALKMLARCSNPLAQARQQLGLEQVGARARGLQSLRELPRVVLAEAVDAEVSLVPAAGAIATDGARSDGERASAWMAIFTLGLRNTAMAVEVIGKVIDIHDCCFQDAISGRLDGKQGLAVVAGYMAVLVLEFSFATQLESATMRRLAEEAMCVVVGCSRIATVAECVAERCQEYLLLLLELTRHEDEALAVGAAYAVGWPAYISGTLCAGVYLATQEYLPAMLALLSRLGVLDQPVAWWGTRSADVNLDAVTMNGPYGGLALSLTIFPKIPNGSTAWEELLDESIHILKTTQELELSTQMMFYAIQLSAKVVGIAAREQSKHEALLASGVVDALLWTTAHDSCCAGATLAQYAAGASVALIGRNEGGLTLTRRTVDVVMEDVHLFWDQASTHFRAKAAVKAPVTKLIGRVQPIIDIVIADTNKPFVLQHKTALDDLVNGLLVDESQPRRRQEGAAKLQEICALVLQNLSLSDAGKSALRSHSGVMAALQSVASGSGGLSDQGRRYASGALFELDEAMRQKTKEAAALAQDVGTAAIEHIMLSYNWDHQDVIKRINASLVSRGYTTWIDVERMQGSTVEAMADAVEGAAVM